MKKSIKTFVLLCVLVASCLVFVLTGCDKTDKKLQSVKQAISYYNDQMFVAEDDNFYLEIVSGKKEKSLVADGEVGEMTSYCSLSVTPVKYDMIGKVMSFKLVGEKGEFSGECSKSIVGISHIAQITDFEKLGKLNSIAIVVGDTKFEYKLQNITEKALNYEKAVESVYQNCKQEIENMFDGNKFKSEIYVKIACDKSKNPKKYYWFVNVVENSDNMLCILVDMETGKLIAKKQR